MILLALRFVVLTVFEVIVSNVGLVTVPILIPPVPFCITILVDGVKVDIE